MRVVNRFRVQANPSSNILQHVMRKFIDNRSQANEVTKESYRRHLKMFMDQVGKTIPVTAITESDVRAFCFKSTIKPATQSSYLRHVKVFFRWAHKNGIIKTNVAGEIKPPKVPKKISGKVFTIAELEQVFSAFDSYNRTKYTQTSNPNPKLLRRWFKPMIWTIYYCGLRSSEAVNLRWENIDLSSRIIHIINTNEHSTKSGKDRSIPIRKPLLPVLKKWHRDQDSPRNGYVFPSIRDVTKQSSMCPRAVSKTFKKFVRLASLSEMKNLHGLRHSCATELIREGLNLSLVSKFLGHSSLSVTQIYEHLNADDLQMAVDSID
jgi:integrase/recombinase XerD